MYSNNYTQKEKVEIIRRACYCYFHSHHTLFLEDSLKAWCLKLNLNCKVHVSYFIGFFDVTILFKGGCWKFTIPQY